MRIVSARRDPSLRVRIIRGMPLRYAGGADPSLDRPAHARAASGIAWVGGRLAVIQDDADFLAIADPDTGLADALPLPPGPGGLRQFDDLRGNKHHKLDLEACVVVPGADGGTLVAFGSGSTARREHLLLAPGISGTPRLELRHAPAFYAALRASAGFAGSELNVEGAAWRNGRILLLNRGNGAPSAGREAVDATCEIAWDELRAHLDDPARAPAPAPESVVRYDLGMIDGQRLTFTDAASFGDTVVFTAAAEDSPDAVRDGPVVGSAVGVIGADGGARWARVEEGDGARFDGKVEGVAAGTRAGTLLLVVDRDDPLAPSELCEAELAGPWPDAVVSPPRDGG